MSQMKLKGMVKNETLGKILNNVHKNDTDVVYKKDGDIEYWTGKNLFVAKKHGVMYWDIHIIHGRAGVGRV